jgi:2-dehydro-3-deoxyphosphogluconate aldolase/(4S)-4-hydroxy-2-oxoglutarate aldolase
VLSVAQAEQAIAAGARYIVAPGFDPALVDWCRARDVPVLPGMATPTEVTMALAHGVRLLKFFPAEESGGVRMLRVLYAPFRDMWTERQGEQDIPLSLELSNSYRTR